MPGWPPLRQNGCISLPVLVAAPSTSLWLVPLPR